MTLQVEKLDLRKKKFQILKDISCTFCPGILNGIIGVNGSGKSMLMKSILGLEPCSGKISFKGEKLSSRDYSYIPQEHEVIKDLTVFEVVLLGLYHDLSWNVRPDQIDKTNEILESFDLLGLAHRKLSTLSGGQRQMVFLAQALIKEPQLIFADEPTSALDLKHQLEYFHILGEYTVRHNCITLIILHDLSMVSRFAKHIYIMDKGELSIVGEREEVIKKEILEEVYGVELDIMDSSEGFKSILPLKVKKPSESFHL